LTSEALGRCGARAEICMHACNMGALMQGLDFGLGLR
jgi:hypothetical protein